MSTPVPTVAALPADVPVRAIPLYAPAAWLRAVAAADYRCRVQIF